MPRLCPIAVALLGMLLAAPSRADEDAEGCKDHPLFNRLPSYHIEACESVEFGLLRFPKGPLEENKEGEKRARTVEVEGPIWRVSYELNEDARPSSPLQVMRNFQAATKKGGGTIEGEYPEWCLGSLDESLNIDNGCTNFGVSMRFQRGDRELWAYAQALDDGRGYNVVIGEREAMKQQIVANALLDKINKDGFIALYLNFETAKATLEPDSGKTLDEVADALKASPDLKLEVAGHTDNVGSAEANQKLSEERAKAVVTALATRGVKAARLTAKGYGQSTPVADNRSEEGRAKNRRVELVKK